MMGSTVESAVRHLPGRREPPQSVSIVGWSGVRWPYFLAHAFRAAGIPLVYPSGDGPEIYKRVGLRALVNAHPSSEPVDASFRSWAGLAVQSGGATLTVDIDEDYFSALGRVPALVAAEERSEVAMPYFSHPRMLAEIDKRGRVAHDEPRAIRIGFAGSVGPHYKQFHGFGMLDREQIISRMMQTFGAQSELAGPPKSWSPSSPIVLVLAESSTQNIRKHMWSGGAYLDLLTTMDFVLTPPGVIMPHSHNVVEGMSRGAIPIMPYSALMCPPLDPGVNCFAFSTLDELDEAVEAALSMPPARVIEMREAVLRYYYGILDPATVGRQIFERTPTTLYVNAEVDSVQAFLHSRGGPSTD